MKLKKLTLLFFVFASTIVSANCQYNPAFLVPYYNNGLWGWSDTLANIKIQPKFKERVDFFDNIGNSHYYFSKINVDEGKYKLINTKGVLLLPEKYHINLSSGWARIYFDDFLVVEDKQKKKGLFSLSQNKVVVPVTQDTILIFPSNVGKENLFFYKTKNQKTYNSFKLKTNKIETTSFVDFNYISCSSDILIASGINGAKYGLVEGKFKKYTRKEYEYLLSNNFKDSPPMWEEAVAGNYNYPPPNKNLTNKYKLDSLDFGNFRKVDGKEFRKLYVVQKGGLQGIITDKDEVLLPLEYTEIKLNQINYGIVTLKKNNKVGMKILFTFYPTIEPKYDDIHAFRSLQVTNRWHFSIFEVTIGNKKLLIGENGVEYFKLM